MRQGPEYKNRAACYVAAWAIVLLSLFLSNCASPPKQVQPVAVLPDDSPEPLPPITLEQQLRTEVNKWDGTPHRMGGTDRSGIDCSAFVQRIYKDLFAIQLPRTTAYQVQYGQEINGPDLQTGDLVFFRPSQKGRHVGIYLSGREFAHASKIRGVTVSSMDEPYWRQIYWTARRVFPEDS
jgi:cell wall-associated NlpC family hydrolase